MPPANFEDDDPYRLDAHMDADPPSDDEGVSNSDLGDNGGGMEDPMDITSNMDSTSAPAQPPKRRGRPRKPEEPKKKQPAPPKSPLKRGRGRPPKNGVQVLRDVLDNADVPKAEEEEEEEEYARPAKRSRKDLGPAKAPQPKSSSKNKPPPSQRDPNAKITSMKSTNAAKLAMARKGRDESTTSEKTFDLGAKGRSNWHARSEDPDEDDGVQRTRSGRTAVKPMAFWRNERIEYGEGRDIRKIIRTEVVDLPKRKPGRPKGSKNRVKEARESREEPLEEWEQSDGVMKGIVRQWSLKMGEEAIWADNEIAYAAPAIRTQEVANSNFRYAKTLALPFFGSGVVDLPPGGAKRPKNSRKMHMVFYVFEGKVLVTVGETEFSIGKGGMWQVPRGNFYSITNELEKTARIFFAQGCEMEPER
ncbi:MAG: hypothetical protein M1833_002784 [Piccolia ochrophora]|nr:MAG: hypothetical protein M1833_002784 [Piccolia ochrophora]